MSGMVNVAKNSFRTTVRQKKCHLGITKSSKTFRSDLHVKRLFRHTRKKSFSFIDLKTGAVKLFKHAFSQLE